MAKRGYGQYCSLATALEVVGGRWTLLVVRELFAGPKRFSDLRRDLPGISPGLLSERLRFLGKEGIVAERRLPPPAASKVYELTESGRGLDEALEALGRWATHRLGPPEAKPHRRPRWLLQLLCAAVPAEGGDGTEGVYGFVIGDEEFRLVVGGDRVFARDGTAHEPRAIVEASFEALHALVTGDDSPKDVLLGAGTDLGVRVSGDRGAAATVLERLWRGMRLAEGPHRSAEVPR